VAEVNQRLAALEECITRSQQVVDAALAAGASAEDMSPASSRVTAAREALDEARQLLQEGKNQEAMDRLTKALEDCNQIEAMALQARDASLERARKAQMRAQAEAQIKQVASSIESARQAIHSAEVAGATADELAAARSALASAEAALQEAKELLAQGDPERALSRLEVARSDSLSARDMGNQAGVAAATRASAKPKNYTVVRGDTLWGISSRTPIYENPFMWPLIYKANRDQIRDPDLIYPDQVFAIPRDYSQEEANVAVHRARTRGPWRLGDGPDYYILEGVRR
jgi:nucleoid-associated protein YgaU